MSRDAANAWPPPGRFPSFGLVMVTSIALAAFFALPCWAWGGAAGLLGHPARAGAFAIIGLAAGASLFTGINLGGCIRADAHDRWMLAPLVLLSLGIAWLPAYADRHDLATIDGDATRDLGLALMAIGSVFRVGPMFVLGRRFTWPLASQPGHKLVTTGFYRFVRHPSYAGAFLGGIGWVLVFRSGLGLILIALLLPAFLPVVRAEESLLMAEFGDEYAAYRRRTWRLLPFVY